MEFITKVLYWISTGLMIPVVLFLILFFIRGVVLIGGFYGDYMLRLKQKKAFDEVFDNANALNISELIGDNEICKKARVGEYIQKMINNSKSKAHSEKLLADFEIIIDKELGLSKTLSKMGPMLGLMGTLIPMGPALVGLASGDTASMASNMQVAFSTTVVGILVGAIGVITNQVKKRWLISDLNNIEFIFELLKENRHNEA